MRGTGQTAKVVKIFFQSEQDKHTNLFYKILLLIYSVDVQYYGYKITKNLQGFGIQNYDSFYFSSYLKFPFY